jgi:hypothetical protein
MPVTSPGPNSRSVLSTGGSVLITMRICMLSTDGWFAANLSTDVSAKLDAIPGWTYGRKM